jgi:hypothetical protein
MCTKVITNLCLHAELLRPMALPWTIGLVILPIAMLIVWQVNTMESGIKQRLTADLGHRNQRANASEQVLGNTTVSGPQHSPATNLGPGNPATNASDQRLVNMTQSGAQQHSPAAANLNPTNQPTNQQTNASDQLLALLTFKTHLPHRLLVIVAEHYRKMCGSFPSQLQTLLTSVEKDTTIVGLEAWLPSTLREIYNVHGGGVDATQLPPLHKHPFDLSVHSDRLDVPVFVAHNPKNPELVKRMTARMAFVGLSFEWIDFGNLSTVVERAPWIEKHVSREPFNMTASGFDYHLLATFTAFEFIERVSKSPLQSAVYLETDAVPVFGFRIKLNTFLRQLHGIVYDIAWLGTCFNLDAQTPPQQFVSPNVAFVPSTRCFNAVILTQAGARKIMGAGASTNAAYFAVDHIFNALIKDIPLQVAWAHEPLIYEESKIPLSNKFTC